MLRFGKGIEKTVEATQNLNLPTLLETMAATVYVLDVYSSYTFYS